MVHEMQKIRVVLLFIAGLIPALFGEEGLGYYERGRALVDSAQWEDALQTWWQGKSVLDGKGKVDPRLGISFIETAVKYQYEKYYGSASEFYLWGFSKSCPEHIETVCEEALRIIPLLDLETGKKWKKQVKKKDPSLSHQIVEFWMVRDPRPSTPGNERLIEHWQRIIYSRRHFIRNRFGSYGCDDRGDIYVKYGEPTRKKVGRFGQSAAFKNELYRWITNRIALKEIEELNPTPEYEVWIYNTIDLDEPMVFLFSDEHGGASLGLVNSIEDVLGYRAPWILCLAYYAELAHFDDLFNYRYKQIEHIWFSAERYARQAGGGKYSGWSIFGPRGTYLKLLRSIRSQNKAEGRTFLRRYQQSHPQKSEFAKSLGEVHDATTLFRFLDDKNEPVLHVVSAVSPSFKPEQMALDANKKLIPPPYWMKTVLVLKDGDNREMIRQHHEVAGTLDDLLLCSIPHIYRNAKLDIGYEARTRVSENTTGIEGETPSSLLALGHRFLDLPASLSRNEADLELSDLVYGLKEDGMAISLPFSIVPRTRMTAGNKVAFGLEIYHLWVEDGHTQGRLEYGINRIKGKGEKIKRKKEIFLAYDFKGASRRHSETLTLNLESLKPGEYELMVKVTDLLSNQSKVREKLFTLEK